MESLHSYSDVESLTKELSQGREMTMQLQNLINAESSSSSHENTCNYLLRKILYSYDQSLSMLKHNRPPNMNTNIQDSPRSLVSDDSDPDFKDQASRKRKSVTTKWTQKVTVCPETGTEGQLEDGYNWRKYGQKDILGAKHPRGYYRCSHRHGQGCLATKQVQRSDEDPTVFEITYRRNHTCNGDNINNQPIAMPGPQNQDTSRQELKFNTQTVITQDYLNPSTFDPFDFSISSAGFNSNIFSDCGDISGDFNFTTTESSYFTDNFGGFNQNPDGLIAGSELNPIVAASITSTITSTRDSRLPASSSESGLNFGFENLSYYP